MSFFKLTFFTASFSKIVSLSKPSISQAKSSFLRFASESYSYPAVYPFAAVRKIV